MVFRQSNWYLYAFCQERNDFRLFKLNRIVSSDILEKQFRLRSVKT
ncbi:WYL domain-containing protein [Fontibacillus panacisegetis]